MLITEDPTQDAGANRQADGSVSDPSEFGRSIRERRGPPAVAREGTAGSGRAGAAEVLPLRSLADSATRLEGLVGNSAALRAVLARATKVAPTDSTVLITGETGTGKELVARAIHNGSRRASRRFVSVNCAAIPQSLLTSELFGHERGAFTGAVQQHRGRFELATGGTLFLDEVGELPVETQVALLRVLQEREFERVGGTTPIRADVRVIAATNRDLERAIAAGSFRSDLYYRLNVFPLEMPPLRERPDDILPLVEYFVERCAQRAGTTIRGISKRTVDLLERYPWPGNVRELHNVIERSVIVCESEVFSVDQWWLRGQALRPNEPTPYPHPAGQHPTAEIGTRAATLRHRAATLEEAERDTILRTLHATNWVVGGPSGAAVRLGLKRTTLQARIKKHGIAPLRFTTPQLTKVGSDNNGLNADKRLGARQVG